jgi:hypothetical protein
MSCSLHAAALGLAASFLVPVSAYAQSLAEVAAREKERRAAGTQKVKSYSEDDLGRGGVPASSFETPSDDSAAPAEGAEAASGEGSQEGSAPAQKSEDERASQEKAWRARVKNAQDTLNGTAAEIEGIQKSLADNTGNYYSTARTNMLNRLDGLTKKYAAEKDALDALREEGRRSSFRE